ncbi:MAG TPA: hypothetical protein DHN33_10590 [Eubacteriaceae bacterium]|nr:hypothetical protein [Eubacteriaceae bacterium]
MVTGIHPKEKIDPGKYNRLIKKATALSPEDRFQNVFELKKEFVKINKKHEASAIRLIPGFRSKTAWKMITAGLFYFMLVAMAFSSVGESANTVVGLIDGILFLGFVFSVIALFFYGRRRFQLPLLTHDNFFVCIFGYLAYILLLIIVYGLLLDVLQIFI